MASRPTPATSRPWFDGELAFSLGPLPPASALSKGDTSAMGSFRGLALLSVKDPTAAAAWFDAAFKKGGATSTTEAYGGTTITVFPETSGVTTAFAIVDGKVAVFGDLASVKAAIDTKGNGGFAKEPGPKAALDSSTGDHVGFMYLALRPLLDWSNDASKSLSQLGNGAIAGEVLIGCDAQARPGLDRLLALVRERRDRHGGHRAEDPRRSSARPRTAPRRSPSTSPRRPSSPRPPTTTARRSVSCSTCTSRNRHSSPCSTSSTRGSDSSAAPMRRSAGSATRPSSSTTRTGCPKAA